MLRTISLTRNGKNKFRYGLKKNLSTLTTSSTNKKPISLFIESNPFHYKLRLETHKQKINTKDFSERKYFNKRLIDSIENKTRIKNLNSDQYDSNISNLMTKYIYSNPDIENNLNTNYELTRTKIKFFNEKKKKIRNFLKKSKSVFKYSINESKYDEDETEKNTFVNIKNIEFKDPVDSLGLLLRNKIVHDKILLNYQDRQVQDYGKKIHFFNDLNKYEIFSKKSK